MTPNSEDVEKILLRDPACIYPRMDDSSKELYHSAVRLLAHRCQTSEMEIVEAAHRLAEKQLANKSQGAFHELHIGYYLCDDGRAALCEMFHSAGEAFPVASYIHKRRIVAWCVASNRRLLDAHTSRGDP